MDIYNIEDMTKGWFVGNFNPTVYQTSDVEVAVKKYKKGEYENKHHHRIATEITVIIQGRVMMSGKEYKEGNIIVIQPRESTDFMSLEDTISVVVKIPGYLNDKYEGSAE